MCTHTDFCHVRDTSNFNKHLTPPLSSAGGPGCHSARWGRERSSLQSVHQVCVSGQLAHAPRGADRPQHARAPGAGQAHQHQPRARSGCSSATPALNEVSCCFVFLFFMMTQKSKLIYFVNNVKERLTKLATPYLSIPARQNLKSKDKTSNALLKTVPLILKANICPVIVAQVSALWSQRKSNTAYMAPYLTSYHLPLDITFLGPSKRTSWM